MVAPQVMWHRFVEAYNAKDFDAMERLYADNAELEVPGGGPIRGRPAIMTFMREVQFRACPDAKTSLIAQALSGQTVIGEWTDVGINTGPLTMPNGASIPPTGKSRTVRGVDVLEIEDDQITSHRFYFDPMSVLAQLGLLPAAAAG
jgi:limonene-1,2-epoxide hydrolase